MALVPAEHDPLSRRRVFIVYVQHGVVGLAALAAATVVRRDEPAAVIEALGPFGPALIALLFLCSTVLAMLKFNLTEEIFVSLAVTAYIAMCPLLGMVLSAWIAVTAAATQRVLGMLQIGPLRVEMRDPPLEWARTFALTATYGIPVIVAVWFFERIGGSVPTLQPTVGGAARITALGVVLVLTNNLIVARVEQALGYSLRTTVRTAIVDQSIYLVTIPFAILMTFAYGAIGWGGVLAAVFTWIIANMVARKLAHIRADRDRLIQRLASLTNVGKTISLDCSIDELLERLYAECSNFIDMSISSIALYDPASNELSFELNVMKGEVLPKVRLPLGDGLNSWVVRNARPLLIDTSEDEGKLGIVSYDDGVNTESWLGVPMIARDHVIGVISIQSFRKYAFSQSELVLLTAVANQAAAAIENAHLYRDLEGLNVVLEQRVSERTNELREANLNLMAANRSKNQFLTSMSHELRTPLNAVIGFSSILLQSTKDLLPARLHRMVENIRTAGSHLLDLINDILDLAKIETGKLQLELQAFDMRETVAAVDRVIRGMAAERDVTVMSAVDPAVSDANLDEVRVKQILLNLLSNAVKFSHRGGFVRLDVSVSPADASPLECESLRMEVTDQGIGIGAADLEKIFDEFYQARGPENHGGTGLGLSLTHTFVQMHHGTISVASELGRGSTFLVYLPRDYAAAAVRRTPVGQDHQTER